MYSLGIDIGSSSVKVALTNQELSLEFKKYTLHKGNPKKTLGEILRDDLKNYLGEIKSALITGKGAEFLKNEDDIEYINELTCISEGIKFSSLDVKSIIEIGGQSSKFISNFDIKDSSKIKFALNSNCSAGTGSFLEDQLDRFGLELSDASEYIQKATSIPRIAGRCSVFAKTDMIHHQQEGKSGSDILLGLCYALIRSYKNSVVKQLEVKRPVAFVGGVANNQGVVRAVKDVFSLEDEELIIPDNYEIMGALGAAAIALKENKGVDLESLSTRVSDDKAKLAIEQKSTLKSLSNFGVNNFDKHRCTGLKDNKNTSEKINAYLGIDIGSTSTNLVLMDENNEVITFEYLKTAGRPIDVVRSGLKEIGKEYGDKVKVVGVGTTGSGRYMIGDFVGADLIRDEITAQANAATTLDDEVDTIFEIGGQDSKYIRIKNGVVVDFEMNKVCAAGTGSFIEEQAKKLDIPIEDFAEMAIESDNPLDLGERCTVFIESNISKKIAKGAEVKDISAGLSYSIVKNYLNRVVGSKDIGDKIFFQGGVAHNQGVLNAFKSVLNKDVEVPPFFSITGALGAALLAKEEKLDYQNTDFKGFNIANDDYEISDISCNRCSNLCQVKKIKFEGKEPKFYGARCDIFEKDNEEKQEEMDIFEQIDSLYLEGYDEKLDDDKETIAIPRVLFMHKLFPLFNTFFKELGYNVLLSPASDEETVKLSQEYTLDETCYPIKLINGHVGKLLREDIDYLFLPSLYTMKHEISQVRNDYACSYMQSVSKIVNEVMGIEERGIEMLSPTLNFKYGKAHMMKTLVGLGRKLGASPIKSMMALKKGMKVLKNFDSTVEEIGEEVVSSIKPDEKVFVLITRAYGIVDPELNMGIPDKIKEMGYKVLPLSALPAHDHDLFAEYPNMYWPFGQHILSGAQIVKNHPNLYPIYLTNHGCGPDTALAHFFSEELGDKPYLHLEVDEHSSNVGVITRIEAFINSLKSHEPDQGRFESLKKVSASVSHESTNIERKLSAAKNKTVYIPYIYPYSNIIAATLKREGIKTEVLDMTDRESVGLGRTQTISKEYFSLTALFGDVFKKVDNLSAEERGQSAFLIPTSEGSEVYGQYNRLIRSKLDQDSYKDVSIIAPYLEDLILEDEILDLPLALLAGDIVMTSDSGMRDEILDEILSAAVEGELKVELLEDLAKKIASNQKKFQNRNKLSLIGEPTILFNDFMNNFVTRELEEQGIKLLFQPLSEVISFSWKGKLEILKDQKKIFKYRSAKRKFFEFQRKISKIDNILKSYSPFNHDLDHIEDKADEYLGMYTGGLGRYRSGKLAAAANKSDGVLLMSSLYENTGTILDILTDSVQKNSQVPILNLKFDGTTSKNDKIRLETFIHYLLEEEQGEQNYLPNDEQGDKHELAN